MLFGEELSVDIAFGDGIMSADVEGRVSGLNGKTILEIQETDLAHVLELAACLTDFGFLVPSVAAGAPPEYGERSGADLALFVVIRFCLNNNNNNNHKT